MPIRGDNRVLSFVELAAVEDGEILGGWVFYRMTMLVYHDDVEFHDVNAGTEGG